jgi:O-antigen/teichoic acid export membrane protein
MLGFGGWAAVSNFAWPFFFHLDRLLLGAITGMRALGYYTPPFEIINRLGIIPASVWMTFFPAMSSLHARNDVNRQARLIFRSIKALLLAAGSAAVLAMGLGPAFLRVWVGDEFAAQGGIALQILAVGFLADSLSIIPLGVLQGSGRTDVPGRIHIGELVLYAPAAYFLIRAFGLPGAAAAWTLQSAANAILLFRAARSYRSARCPADLKVGLGRAAAACGLFAAATLASAALGAGHVGVILAAGIFAGAVWRWVLDGEERNWIAATLRRMARRKTPS